MTEILTVGIQLQTSDLVRGTQTARQAITQLGAAETQLERQTKSVETASKALAATETTLARAIDATDQQAKQAGSGLDQLTRQTQQAGTAKKALTGGLQAMLGPFGSVQGAVTALGAYLGGQFVRSVVETAGRMQTLQLSLDAITGSTRAGADAMVFIRQTANQLGVGTLELAQNYRQFIAATQGANLGLTTQRQLMTGLVAANKVAGGSTDTLTNAMRALNQIIGLGKVTAENWTGQLEDALPGITNKTAAALGMTTEKFRELMAAGQLGIDKVFPALIRVLGQDIPRAAAIAGSSIEGETARMKNSFTDLFSAIGQSPMMQAFTKNMGDAVRWMHDFGAAVGAVNPRPLTAIEQITERINALRRETTLSGQRSLATNQQLAELETQRLALIKLQTQQQQALTAQEAARTQVATTGPTGVTRALTTQIDQETAAIQRRYTVGQTVGLPQLERERAKLSDLNKVLQEHLDVLASAAPLTDADRKAREANAIAAQDQIEATEGVIKILQEEEQATKRLHTETARLAEREVDLQLRYQATHIALTQGTQAGEAYEARTNAMTEAEKRAEASHLRRSSAIRAENRELERAAQLTEEWKDILKGLEEEYARASMSEADYLAKRLQAANAPPEKIADALVLQEGITIEQEKTSIQQQARAEYKATMRTLQEDTLITERALERNLALDEARVEVQQELIAGSNAELVSLRERYDLAQATLALYKAQAGLGTAGLPADMAIQSFRDRGMTQGVVEGEPGPIEQRLGLVSTATSRFSTELQQARLDLLALGGPEVVQTFDDLTIKRFGAVTEGLYEFEDGLFSVREAALEMSATVLNALNDLATGGKASFKDLATSIINDLMSILQQKFLLPQMAKWSELAISAGLKLLGGLGGAGATGVGGAATTALAVAGSGSFLTSQHGGPLRHGLTLVGEAGPEAIISRGGRSMVFPTSHPISRMAVRAHLPGRQFGGPLPSAVMGGTGSDPPGATMTSTAQGQGAGVTQNFYIQTPDAQSLIKSKGEVQRAMMSAFRSAQRS